MLICPLYYNLDLQTFHWSQRKPASRWAQSYIPKTNTAVFYQCYHKKYPEHWKDFLEGSILFKTVKVDNLTLLSILISLSKTTNLQSKSYTIYTHALSNQNNPAYFHYPSKTSYLQSLFKTFYIYTLTKTINLQSLIQLLSLLKTIHFLLINLTLIKFTTQ